MTVLWLWFQSHLPQTKSHLTCSEFFTYHLSATPRIFSSSSWWTKTCCQDQSPLYKSINTFFESTWSSSKSSVLVAYSYFTTDCCQVWCIIACDFFSQMNEFTTILSKVFLKWHIFNTKTAISSLKVGFLTGEWQ